MSHHLQDFIRKFIPPKEESKSKKEEEKVVIAELTIEKQRSDLPEKSEKLMQISKNCSNIR